MLNSIEKMEILENKEQPDNLGYKDIGTDSKMPLKEVYDFWNDVFSEKSDVLSKELSEEELWERMFSQEKSDFFFDFDRQDTRLQEIMTEFEGEKWDKLSESEKIEVMDTLVSYLCDVLGIENKPALRFFEDDENICGAFNPQTNTIDVNKNTLNNPKEIVDTLAHEARHAYQHQRAAIGETDTDKLYAFNFANYISPSMIDNCYIFFWDYEEQFVEAEARAFANLFRS